MNGIDAAASLTTTPRHVVTDPASQHLHKIPHPELPSDYLGSAAFTHFVAISLDPPTG
jgi:hypothetical protein